MTEDMALADYLKAGGKLTHPDNVPPRYRAELMKLMATFVDSQLAGAAGFADVINAGPGIKERIAAARIVLEKTDHAERVLNLMGQFGANTARYASHHPWTDRLPRDTAPGALRNAHDMRLSVLNYPLQGWTDAVTMNFVTGHAVLVQIEAMTLMSYQPFAEVLKELLPRERRHVELAEEGLDRLIAREGSDAIRQSLAYWMPRASAVFGDPAPERFAQLRSFGLRSRPAHEMRQAWKDAITAACARMQLEGIQTA